MEVYVVIIDQPSIKFSSQSPGQLFSLMENHKGKCKSEAFKHGKVKMAMCVVIRFLGVKTFCMDVPFIPDPHLY